MTGAGLPLETIVLSVATGVHWSTVHLHASAEEAARKATFVFPMPPLAMIGAFTARPDMPATVTVSGELWLTGRIGQVSPSHGDSDGEITVEVLSETIDSVESSVDHPTGYIEGADALGIAQEFESTNVKWTSKASLTPEEWHDINPGEGAFDTVERLLRSRGKLIYDDEKGQMVIADKPEGRHSGGLVLGVNISQASAILTSEGRHDPVKVRGQSSIGRGPAALRMEAEANDPDLGRPRPKIVLLEGDATEDRLRERAQWEQKRAAGRSKTATVTVPSWRDQGGMLWTRNMLVGLHDPLLLLDQDMIIKSVDLHQDGGSSDGAGGTSATLSLADPQALGGSAGKSGSDKAWKTPDKKAKLRVL